MSLIIDNIKDKSFIIRRAWVSSRSRARVCVCVCCWEGGGGYLLLNKKSKKKLGPLKECPFIYVMEMKSLIFQCNYASERMLMEFYRCTPFLV